MKQKKQAKHGRCRRQVGDAQIGNGVPHADLDVGPGGLQGGLVLLGVKVLVFTRGEGPEYVGADL